MKHRLSTTFTLVAMVCLLLAAGLGQSAPLDRSGKLSMQLENVDIAVALSMIAEQNNLNIVVGGDVTGQVSLRLVEVDLQSALEAILAPGGYSYYIRNDVLVVKPMETYAVGELVSKPITLKYLDPNDIKGAVESRLSSRGKLVIVGGAVEGEQQDKQVSPNRIVITDLPAVVVEIATLIEELDQPLRMISIEVKIIESKIDAGSKLGFAWPTSVTTRLGARTTNNSGDAGTGSSTGNSLNNTAGNYDIESGRWTWSTLTVDQLTAVLDLLNSTGNSKLISDPHITMLENHEAYIKVQTIIPIATISRFSEGAATSDIQTFYDEEIGITLSVTPRINEGNRITLNVLSTVEDIIGYSGPADNQKPITSSRSIKTIVTVNEGETIALGGLLKETEIERIQKVPLLGRIPLLGKLLFTNKSSEKTTTDLIILITPRIMP